VLVFKRKVALGPTLAQSRHGKTANELLHCCSTLPLG
jgi:hypothetical protein